MGLYPIVVLGLGALLALPADAQPKKKSAYGAVAYYREGHLHGYAYDFPTARAASIEALKDCGHAKCEVLVSFQNACGAVADGPVKKPVAAKGATPEEAQAKALKACAVKDCKVVAWACTR